MDKEEAVFERLPNFKRPQKVEFHNEAEKGEKSQVII